MPRTADAFLKERLHRAGAVLLRGPRWCGKTNTAGRKQQIVFIDDPNRSSGYIELADTVLVLWDAVRHTVNRQQKARQFTLTADCQLISSDALLLP